MHNARTLKLKQLSEIQLLICHLHLCFSYYDMSVSAVEQNCLCWLSFEYLFTPSRTSIAKAKNKASLSVQGSNMTFQLFQKMVKFEHGISLKAIAFVAAQKDKTPH